jgi:UDPglucose 6-dehydrogenase
VGLVAGACFADSGNDVICVDKDADKIDRLREGKIPIYEPGLAEIVGRNVRESRLTFVTDLGDAVRKSFVIFVAVGTPSGTGGESDLGAIHAVAAEIGRSMNQFKVIVIKSTVPVGTGEAVADIIRSETDQPFDVISNPEFLKEGAAVEDFTKPDRIIIGAEDERAAAIVRELYAPFTRTGSPTITTDVRSAEMIKYASNAYLATRISFMNEVANLCEHLGADVDTVRKGMGLDKRIGASFLFPGLGFGGHCFPKDMEALMAMGRRNDYPLRLLEAAMRLNSEQRIRFLNKILGHFGDVTGRRFAVWGLAFKPQTDDMREAPSIDILNGLLSRGAQVTAYDPEAMAEARKIFGDRISLARNNYDCLRGADALLILTEWQTFRNPNLDRMKSEMASPVVFDGRNIYDPSHMREMGFTYYGIGRR